MSPFAHLALGALAATLFAAILRTDQDAQGARSDLRVLSANIRYGLADDGAHSWKERSAFTLETLEAADADILGLQEALDFQVHEIHDAFPGHTLIGEGRDAGGEGEWCALLVRSERFAIRASGTIWLHPEGKAGALGWDAACPRIATWAELVDREAPAAPFLVLNTHFDHRGKEARRRSAELIVGWGKTRQKTRGPMAVLLLGDLNAGEDSPPLRVLTGAGMVDTFRVRNPEANPVGTFHGFEGGRDGARIDFVLATEHWRVRDAWIDWTEKDGRYPSDHRFVGARLRRGD